MAEEPKTFQPDWGKPHKHHHHHHSSQSSQRNRGWGGSLRMRDRQAYYGLMLVLIVCGCVALYMFYSWAVKELRSMPLDDPETEMAVDELRIRPVAEREALHAGDSIAQVLQFDSTKIKHVQIATRSVYRPPRQENKWYITRREWKEIWRSIRVRRMEKQQAEQEAQQEKQQQP